MGTPSADVQMFLGRAKAAPKGKAVARKGSAASPTKPKVTAKAKPLSPGSNYPTTKNINPAYLAAERKELAAQSKKNVSAERAKTKKMKAAGTFELGSLIAKKVGNVGSNKEYYQSGR